MIAWMRLSFIGFILIVCAGCEITASMYVQKDWNTDPARFDKNDLTTKAEVKITKLIGNDAKRAKLSAMQREKKTDQ